MARATVRTSRVMKMALIRIRDPRYTEFEETRASETVSSQGEAKQSGKFQPLRNSRRLPGRPFDEFPTRPKGNGSRGKRAGVRALLACRLRFLRRSKPAAESVFRHIDGQQELQ